VMQNQKHALHEKESILIEDGVDVTTHMGSRSSLVIIVTLFPSSR
jgi:hypothetical protein